MATPQQHQVPRLVNKSIMPPLLHISTSSDQPLNGVQTSTPILSASSSAAAGGDAVTPQPAHVKPLSTLLTSSPATAKAIAAPAKAASPDANTAGAPNRGNLRKSCKFCRCRKIKCSGELTGCRECSLRNQECIFESSSTMGRPRKYPRVDGNVDLPVRPKQGWEGWKGALVGAPAVSGGSWKKPMVGPAQQHHHQQGTQHYHQIPHLHKQGPHQHQQGPHQHHQGPHQHHQGPHQHQLKSVQPPPLSPSHSVTSSNEYGSPIRSFQMPFPPTDAGQARAHALDSFGVSSGQQEPAANRTAVEAAISAYPQHHNPLKRKAGSYPPGAGASPIYTPHSCFLAASSSCPSSPLSPNTDGIRFYNLADTFAHFRGEPLAAMARAHRDFFSAEAQSPASMSPPLASLRVHSQAADPAHTREYYQSIFQSHSVASGTSSQCQQEDDWTLAMPNFEDWAFYTGIIADVVAFATAGRASAPDGMNPAAPPPESTFARMIRLDRGGDLAGADGPEDGSPLAGMATDEAVVVVSAWYRANPISLIINDSLLLEAIHKCTCDEALLACIVGWTLHARGDAASLRSVWPTASHLFDWAEKALLARKVEVGSVTGAGWDEAGRTALSTVQALILLAAYRATQLQTRNMWALFSVAHALARESVRRTKASAEAQLGKIGEKTSEQRAMEENILTCSWVMAILAAWSFLSCRLPKHAVLDIIDGLPQLPLTTSDSYSYSLRASRRYRLTKCDGLIAFSIRFVSECTRVLEITGNLCSEGRRTAPPSADLARVSWSYMRTLVGDSRLQGIGAFGTLAVQWLVQVANDYSESPDPSLETAQGQNHSRPQPSAVLAVVYATMALHRISPFGRPSSTPVSTSAAGVKPLIQALSIMTTEAANAIASATLYAQTRNAVDWPTPDNALLLRTWRDVFPYAVLMIENVLEASCSSTDHFTVLSAMQHTLSSVLDGMQALVAAGATLLPNDDTAAVIRLRSSLAAFFHPPEQASPPLVGRSASVPLNFEYQRQVVQPETQRRMSVAAPPLGGFVSAHEFSQAGELPTSAPLQVTRSDGSLYSSSIAYANSSTSEYAANTSPDRSGQLLRPEADPPAIPFNPSLHPSFVAPTYPVLSTIAVSPTAPAACFPTGIL